MANIKIHNVTKIEIRKVDKGNGYNCRDIVIHNKSYKLRIPAKRQGGKPVDNA